MVTINGTNLHESPSSCGTCPFLITGNSSVPGLQTPKFQRGNCLLWDEWHHTWASIPRRCSKIFNKAFKEYNDCGENLVITNKE